MILNDKVFEKATITWHVDVNIPGGPYLQDPSLYTMIFTLYVESNSLDAELYINISGFQILNNFETELNNLLKGVSYYYMIIGLMHQT